MADLGNKPLTFQSFCSPPPLDLPIYTTTTTPFTPPPPHAHHHRPIYTPTAPFTRPKGIKVIEGIKVIKGIQVIKEIKEIMVLQVIQWIKGIKRIKVIKVSKICRDMEAQHPNHNIWLWSEFPGMYADCFDQRRL